MPNVQQTFSNNNYQVCKNCTVTFSQYQRACNSHGKRTDSKVPFLYFDHCLSLVELRPSSSGVCRLCGAIEGRLSHFLPCGLRMGWHSVISQGKIALNTPHGRELNPGHGMNIGIHSFSHWDIMTDHNPYKCQNTVLSYILYFGRVKGRWSDSLWESDVLMRPLSL